MRTFPAYCLIIALFISLLAGGEVAATCGGGGGGGAGGSGEGKVYLVPWRKAQPGDSSPTEGMIVYWIPSSRQDFMTSTLRESRGLTLYASRCVKMVLVDAGTPQAEKLAAGEKLPIVLLTSAGGDVIGKVGSDAGPLKVNMVESLVGEEIKKRGTLVKERLAHAKDKIDSGDKDGAIADLKWVMEQKCFFPGRAKEAEKQLNELGVSIAPLHTYNMPNMDQSVGARVEKQLAAGLKAEDEAKYSEAERLYTSAHEIDPADPVPLRYLGELLRHHIGDWDRAATVFNTILEMHPDPLSEAVALQGLGKMTIHNGQFEKGRKLIEQSLEVYPLAMADRNLAVYWNSEGDPVKTEYYTKEAFNLEPDDPYNLVFSAVFLAGSGHGDEALKIAREHEDMLPASYNLAAIYAQTGHKKEALALLKRHFYQYERTQNVRSKEMMEARVDRVFACFKGDPEFMSLTKDADGKLPIPGEKGMKATSQ